jgi:HlyD family secretion protein
MKNVGLILVFLLLAGCEPDGKTYSGYVEGEYLYFAPTTAGLLQTLSVARGQDVKAGEALFALDPTTLNAEIAAAEYAAQQAKATWIDKTKGQRKEEIEALMAQQAEAKANWESAEKEYRRARYLITTNAISQSDLDSRKAAYDEAVAQVDRIEAQIKTAKLGSREDEIAAAYASYQSSEQKVLQLRKQLADSAPKAPADGRIEDTFYHAGEYVGTGTAVVSFLPPENVKLRFYVPQVDLPHMALGKTVTVRCDGCEKPVEAKINYIASESEYTPPVIYSVGSRDKLVFRVEALPVSYTPALRPGLPVDIDASQK